MRLIDRRANGDPVLAEPTLLAYPEEQQDRTHHQPQQALLALVDILRVQDATTDAAELAGVNPGRVACLLNVIAEQMTVSFTTVERALKQRAILADFDLEAKNAH